MCGIAGCKLKRPLTEGDIARMRQIRDALAHRGPDGVGEHVDAAGGLYLGHRRLSIIDTDSRSNQPMSIDLLPPPAWGRGAGGEGLLSSSLTIVYNGELYNYRELKQQLFAASFRTESDTEVLLQAWAAWGPAALDKFDGMFAFALLDGEGSLHLATDFFGEKPLFLLHRPEGVYFASEAGPLIEAFGLTFAPSPEETADFLYLGYIRPPGTGYAGLETIAQAQHIVIAPDGAIQRRTYWMPPKADIGKGAIEPVSEADIDRVRDLLCRSLELRLRSDVKLGLFLSGGVDSSLIAALAARELNAPLESFTVAFHDGQDESAYAAKIAQHFSLPHRVIDSAADESWRDAPGMLAWLYGVPNDNMTALAVWQMCKAAKPYLTVALSGLGGDELFFGYGKYETLYQRRLFYRHAALWKGLAVLGGKFKRLAGSVTGDAGHDYLCIKNGAAMPYLSALCMEPRDLFDYASKEALPPGPPPSRRRGGGMDLVYKVQQFDRDMSMPQSYIPAIDRGGMRASVEVRAPFLSRPLLEFTAGLDQRALIAHGKKSVTRRLLARYMPADLLTPGKQGFVFPVARYLKSRSPAISAISGLPAEAIRNLWGRREQGALTQATLRLAVLEQAYGRADAAEAA